MASSLTHVAHKIFGSKNEREVKRLRPDVDAINLLEPEMEKKGQEELAARIAELKQSISALDEWERRHDAMLEALLDGVEVEVPVRRPTRRARLH